MLIAVSVPQAALVALATHADSTTLGRLSVDGALLAFDFSDCADVLTAIESLDAMDAFLGLVIAESDDATEIANNSALKKVVANIRPDVMREYAYKTRVRVQSEATETDAGSQLHGEQHTDITVSAESNGALAEKEVSENGTSPEEQQQQQPRRRRKRIG